MKNFFESPSLLLGSPLLVLGLLGLAVAALALLGSGQVQVTERGPVARHGVAHPGPEEYVRIGLLLAAVTAVEVAVYYFDIQRAIFVTILLGLSAVKFSLVVMFFMHLKFDSRLFSTAFLTGFTLASAVFVVVLATLGGSLV
jgi:cytochrome c oxidase subunit 4